MAEHLNRFLDASGAAHPWRVAPLASHGRVRALAVTSLSLVGSTVVCALVFDWALATVLAAAVLTHELGHYAVARVGGVAVSSPIVVLPPGGYVVVDGARLDRNPRAEASVVAAGPLAGALAAVAAAWASNSAWAGTFVHVSLLVNALNLLPVGALDGGRLARLAGLHPAVGWVIGAPAAMWNPWLLTAIVPAALLDDRRPLQIAAHDRLAVRRIALGGAFVSLTLLAIAYHL